MFESEHDLRRPGTWDESRQTVTDTICPYCGVGCTLELRVQDNEIVRVTSPLDHRRHPRPSVHQGPVRLAVRAEPAGKLGAGRAVRLPRGRRSGPFRRKTEDSGKTRRVDSAGEVLP